MTYNSILIRFAIISPLVVGLIIGCEDHGSNPSPVVQVSVDFYSGFEGDSVVVSLDGRVRISAIGYSVHGPGAYGVTMGTYVGQHVMKLEIPFEEVMGDTTIWVRPDQRLNLLASFDRSAKTITYQAEIHESRD
jgi:hypothetical protein